MLDREKYVKTIAKVGRNRTQSRSQRHQIRIVTSIDTTSTWNQERSISGRSCQPASISVISIKYP